MPSDYEKDTREMLTKLEKIVDKVRNRLPVWAVVIFGLLTGIIGWLSKAIAGG